MFRRWMFAGLLTIALTMAFVVSGCGGKTTIITPSAKPSSSSSAAASGSEETQAPDEPTLEPQETLDADACVDVTSANLDLAVATNGEQAQTAADTFEKYNPPASVKEAIDHFVQSGGVQYDDPEFDKFNNRIDEWVKAVCPL